MDPVANVYRHELAAFGDHRHRFGNGQFITVAQGAAGLKFTPTTGSQANGTFTIQESTTAGTTGLISATARPHG